MSVRHTVIDSQVDPLLLVADGDALAGLYFEGYRFTPPPDGLGPKVGAGSDPVFAQAARELAEYFAGKRRVFDVPAVTAGDAMQEQIWARLREIPYGERVTYGDIAIGLGDRSLSQLVGQAVGRNPVSIVIPCHRVVGAGGKLTGFGGGLRRKQILLELEEPDEVRRSRLF